MNATRKRRWWRTLGIAAGIVLVALIALRIALPSIVAAYVNRQLDENPNYDGHVDDIDIALIRGAYAINGVEIVKEVGAVPEPLFAADVVDLSIRWDALWKGNLVGEIEVLRADLNLVNGGDDASSQTGAETAASDWKQTVLDLFPIRIDRLTLVDGEIHYVDRTQDPPIDVAIDELEAVVLNLTNSEEIAGTLVSTIDATGKVEGTGGLTLAARLDPFEEQPTFDANLRVEAVALAPFNKLFNRYARFDVEAGTVDVNVELASEQGKVAGYVKPVLHDVKVVEKGEFRESGEGPVRAAWEVAVGAVKGVLNNEPKEQLATQIPISGHMSDPAVHAWPAVLAALRNAFVEALFNGLDGTIDLSDAALGTTDGGADQKKAEEKADRKAERAARRDERREERANN